jgi:Na+-transporting NADH:ubiquinone oxidoreductase subunit NqrC
VTGNAVTRVVQYWLGPHGYGPLLAQLREQPPAQPAARAAE